MLHIGLPQFERIHICLSSIKELVVHLLLGTRASFTFSAHQPIDSNYLLSASGQLTPTLSNSDGFIGREDNKKHRGASVGAGDAITQLIMALNETIMAWR